ncbi:hypothetical protein OG897_35495 [Streptomyces sp. NBC_00237]|uniref:hypothetical protein n=1 Tax=Streptomyces sp. NBC_00237 TaxID=2975687 RepID=UPI00225AD37E|nr:hypothetical protein [Streptomyces sp. NBC_00237]MCX5206696.1 hypothetical protein [Streptomyces sp. NBC_00237]
MGTTKFFTVGTGPDLQSAFTDAHDLAVRRRWRRAPGRLATKAEAVLIEPKVYTYKAALRRAEELLNAFDPRIWDKWGPAGALEYTGEDDERSWLFFGYAPN